MYITRI
jgi:hypothetical protein